MQRLHRSLAAGQDLKAQVTYLGTCDFDMQLLFPLLEEVHHDLAERRIHVAHWCIYAVLSDSDLVRGTGPVNVKGYVELRLGVRYKRSLIARTFG